MPTYVYQCTQCQHRFDVRQGFTDAPEATCPTCGSEARRQFQPPAIVFKGRGWYSTDNRTRSGYDFITEAQEKSKESGSSESDAEPAASAAGGSADFD